MSDRRITPTTDMEQNQNANRNSGSLNAPVSREWALRLVAKWCENRAAQTADRRLLERCRKAYRNGPLVSPVRRFAEALQSEIDDNTSSWMELAKAMRDEAEEIEAANGALCDGGSQIVESK